MAESWRTGAGGAGTGGRGAREHGGARGSTCQTNSSENGDARAVSRAWESPARARARERRLEARQDTSPGGEKTNTMGRRGVNPRGARDRRRGACAHLVLSEVLHVHDDLAALGGEAGHLALGVALHDDHGGVHSRGLGGPELGGASGLGAGRLALVGARGGREHGALGDADGSHLHCACVERRAAKQAGCVSICGARAATHTRDSGKLVSHFTVYLTLEMPDPTRPSACNESL